MHLTKDATTGPVRLKSLLQNDAQWVTSPYQANGPEAAHPLRRPLQKTKTKAIMPNKDTTTAQLQVFYYISFFENTGGLGLAPEILLENDRTWGTPKGIPPWLTRVVTRFSPSHPARSRESLMIVTAGLGPP